MRSRTLWLSCSSRWGYSSRRVKPQVEEVASSGISLPSRVFSSCLMLKAACCLALSMKPLAISGTPQHFSRSSSCMPMFMALSTCISSLPSCGWL
ncbi:hypothetical protein D3C71_1657120 [compost metagenome]